MKNEDIESKSHHQPFPMTILVYGKPLGRLTNTSTRIIDIINITNTSLDDDEVANNIIISDMNIDAIVQEQVFGLHDMETMP